MVLDAETRENVIRNAGQLHALDRNIRAEAEKGRERWKKQVMEHMRQREREQFAERADARQLERREGVIDTSGVAGNRRRPIPEKKEPEKVKPQSYEKYDEGYFLPPFGYRISGISRSKGEERSNTQRARDVRASNREQTVSAEDLEELVKSDTNLLYILYILGIATENQIDCFADGFHKRNKDLLLISRSATSVDSVAKRYKHLVRSGYVDSLRCKAFVTDFDGADSLRDYQNAPTAYTLNPNGMDFLKTHLTAPIGKRHQLLNRRSPYQLSMKLIAVDVFTYFSRMGYFKKEGHICIECRSVNSQIYFDDGIARMDAAAVLKGRHDTDIYVGILGVLSSYDPQIEKDDTPERLADCSVRKGVEYIKRYSKQRNGRILFVCEDCDAVDRVAAAIQKAGIYDGAQPWSDLCYAITYRFFMACVSAGTVKQEPMKWMYQFYYDTEQEKVIPILRVRELLEDQ